MLETVDNNRTWATRDSIGCKVSVCGWIQELHDLGEHNGASLLVNAVGRSRTEVANGAVQI